MKKIILGMLALSLAMSSIAQETKTQSSEKKEYYKDRKIKLEDGYEKFNLTESQKTQLSEIDKGFKSEMKALNQQGSITVDEQKARRMKLAKEHKEKVLSVLTPEQRKQAETLRMHHARGNKGRAHNRFNITKDLNLSKEQSAKAEALNESFKSNLNSLKQNNTLAENEKKEQMKSLMKKHRSDIESLLTNEQKEQLKNRRGNHEKRAAVK